MGCLLLALVALLLIAASFWVTQALVGLALTLLVAGLIGWAADQLIPNGHLPGGWLGAVLTGIIGGVLGTFLFSLVHVALGPRIFGIHVVPAFVGAVLIAVIAQLASSNHRPDYA